MNDMRHCHQRLHLESDVAAANVAIASGDGGCTWRISVSDQSLFPNMIAGRSSLRTAMQSQQEPGFV